MPIIAGGGAIVLDKGLAQVGLTKADVDLSELAVPNMPAALQNGALDAVMPAEPVVVQIADQGIGVILMYSDEMFPNMESTQWMYSPQFAANRQDVGVKYMIGLLKGARDFNKAFTDGTDKADILNILIKYTSVKDPALYDKMQVSALSGNGSLDASNLQEQIDWLVKYGLVKNRVEASKLIDTDVHGSRGPGNRQGLSWTRSKSRGLTKVFARARATRHGAGQRQPDIPRGQFVCIVGPVRLRQDHAAAHRGRPGAAQLRRRCASRATDRRAARSTR